MFYIYPDFWKGGWEEREKTRLQPLVNLGSFLRIWRNQEIQDGSYKNQCCNHTRHMNSFSHSPDAKEDSFGHSFTPPCYIVIMSWKRFKEKINTRKLSKKTTRKYVLSDKSSHQLSGYSGKLFHKISFFTFLFSYSSSCCYSQEKC